MNFIKKSIALMMAMQSCLFSCSMASAYVAEEKTCEVQKEDVYYRMEDDCWETERLLLTRTNDSDFDDLAPLLLDYEVTKNITLIPCELEGEQQARLFLSGMLKCCYACFTLNVKSTKQKIGQVTYYLDGKNLEISYWLGKEFQGKGYASEAALKLSQFVFEHVGVDNFLIEFCADNPGSKKLASKIAYYMLSNHCNWEVDIIDEVYHYEVVGIDRDFVNLTFYSCREGEEGNKDSVGSSVISKKEFPKIYSKMGEKFSIKKQSIKIKK